MTQRERNRIDSEIGTALLNIEEISDEEIEDSREFLTAVAKLPRLLRPTG
ncbi:hypothetical protein RHABOEDO_001866 (plasmid) [Candidatus Rhabdochlamydia oedothoracis]|uniref:Uncharacterized protein n=1 Tax=Candidatus Rhabdochlamydia oedothoracis TaxID=2720720 RepID=A0ABX8V2N4_9BACT|nr:MULTISPECIES: hypothetical protein [Rhabdochlamydia]KAG6559265.1 hypothetical protein RHOW815_000724 [Candidatus Rhabdochlamydia sp. W815]QYF49473.1 hypothetical protein RHABOEDO_001866 [Candidatus Rhabdochlamydia oedothoracis]